MLNNGINGGGGSGSSSNGMTTPDERSNEGLGGLYAMNGSIGHSEDYSPSPINSNPGSNSSSFHYTNNSSHNNLNTSHTNGGGPNSHLNGGSGGVGNQKQTNTGPQMCGGCHRPILERFLLSALDRVWHNSCLKCHVCTVTLAEIGSSCFVRDGMVLCKHDYSRMFGMRGACQGCGQGIPGDELVMRASVSPLGSGPPLVFHRNCFMCSKCGTHLSTGDRYSVLNGALFCEQDALKMMKNGIGSPSANSPGISNPSPVAGATTTGPSRKGKVGRPRRSRD